MEGKIWRVRAYIEYELEAENEEESIERLGECIYSDLEEGCDIRDIAEVNSDLIEEKPHTLDQDKLI